MSDPTNYCAITELGREHRQIERVLQALNGVIQTIIATGAAVDVELIRQFVDFIERYADGRHHAKEEGVLFREMHAHGFSLESGPLHCMLAQHALGRRFAAELRDWTNAGPEARQDGMSGMLRAALGYHELLLKHIGIEDGVLFSMALAELPRSSLARINERCRELEPSSAAQEMASAADAVVQSAECWRSENRSCHCGPG